MQTLKDQVIDMIQMLPDSATIDDIQYHLYVRKKVESGLQAISDARYMSESVAEEKVEAWSKFCFI